MKLTNRHLAAMRYIIEGRSDVWIASHCGVTKFTVQKWKGLPDFKEKLEGERHRLHERWVELQAGAMPRDDFGPMRQRIAGTREKRVEVMIDMLDTGDDNDKRHAATFLNRLDGFDPTQREPDITLSAAGDKIDLLREALRESVHMRKLDTIKDRHVVLKNAAE